MAEQNKLKGELNNTFWMKTKMEPTFLRRIITKNFN